MLRGSSRHDGIQNKQSAKERDRDRQRERQRQERLQMLPNDNKEINAGVQDLFHAPVKVKPSVEDPTTLEIRNTLGNFETVRHYMLDNSSRSLVNLIGVDNKLQPQLQQQQQQQQQQSSASSISALSRLPLFQPHSSEGSRPSSSSTGVFPVDNNNKFSNLLRGISSSVSHLVSNQPPSSNTTNFRSTSSNSYKVPPHNPNPSIVQYSNSEKSGSKVPVQNPPPRTKNNVPPFYSNNSAPLGASGGIGASTFTSEPSVTCDKAVHSVPPISDPPASLGHSDKSHRVNKKPALQDADSQLELESMLKEMIDVKPPLTAIQTPKETTAKKLTQRRSSKSEEKILVQTIRESVMANVPSPLERMESSADSSSSDETESSDSESEDSSSASQPAEVVEPPKITTSSPTRWNLGSFIRKENIKADSSVPVTGKSPKDGKGHYGEDVPTDGLVKSESVTSTSVFGKSLSMSPLDSNLSGASSKLSSFKASPLNPPAPLESSEPYITKVPGKSLRRTPDTRAEKVVATVPMKGSSNLLQVKGPALSGSSSEDEVVKPMKEPVTRASAAAERRAGNTNTSTTARKRRRPSSSSSESGVRGRKSNEESSPEVKGKKVVQDRNKSDTIRKLFRPSWSKKVESPPVEEPVKTGKDSSGTKSKSSSSNRVSAKDSCKKAANKASTSNGDLDMGAPSGSKKRELREPVEKASSVQASSYHNKKHHKSAGTSSAASHKTAASAPPALPPVAVIHPTRIKEEPLPPKAPANASLSSLICRIPLYKIPRKPRSVTAAVPTIQPKDDKPAGGSHRNSSSRIVGSSSDPNTIISPRPVVDPPSDIEKSSKSHSNRKKAKKKTRSSPKKNKKQEPDSHSKEDEGVVAFDEITSNVLGYTAGEGLVSTTRTPPVESEVAPAPDSSVNPAHANSPVLPAQRRFYSYFERYDHMDDCYSKFNPWDQDTYLEEAKRLKHRADNERVSTAQASTYLEAGLYFILTGIAMERDISVGQSAAFTMYKDTLQLIRYIGNRFRNRPDFSNPVEVKIIVLSMRCQSMLHLKLFKIKMKETKELVSTLQDHFTRVPPIEGGTSGSPQLSTPSPHSPTSSPAGSSSLLGGHNPSPHHNHLTAVPRALYSQMQKHCNNTHNLIACHELWESADALVQKYHIEDFFIQIDHVYGPLTLHNTVVDLVRYVKHALQVLKSGADIS